MEYIVLKATVVFDGLLSSTGFFVLRMYFFLVIISGLNKLQIHINAILISKLCKC